MHVREPAAVGRRRRTRRAAGLVHGIVRLTCGQFMAPDREDGPVRVLRVLEDGPGRDVLAVIHVLPVGRERRLAELLLELLARTLDEHHALAAVEAVEPDLARAERAPRREVLATRNVAAAGMPHGIVQQAEGFLGDLPRAAAARIHDPQVVAAGAIRRERDPLAVGRVARLHVPRQARRERACFAALDRQLVDVAQHIERDALAIRADVDAHPRTGARVDRNIAALAGWRGDVPRVLLLLVGLGGLG